MLLTYLFCRVVVFFPVLFVFVLYLEPCVACVSGLSIRD